MKNSPASGRKLPPLRALRAFEAVARHGSMTRAAEELLVTATAIRHQVKLIEDWSGRRLFQRHNNRLELTEQGRAFFPAVTDAFDRIAAAATDLRGGEKDRALVIGARPNFALRWLVPRLPKFQSINPRIQLRLITSYRSLERMVDELDVAIHLGQKRENARCDFLFSGDLFPVMTPSLIKQAKIKGPADLLRVTRLHVVTVIDGWNNWLNVAGVSGDIPDAGPQFDSFALAIEAAIAGCGATLAAEPFVRDEIKAGRLMAPFAARLARDRDYYLIVPQARENSTVASFRNWLLNEVSSSRRPDEPSLSPGEDFDALIGAAAGA